MKFRTSLLFSKYVIVLVFIPVINYSSMIWYFDCVAGSVWLKFSAVFATFVDNFVFYTSYFGAHKDVRTVPYKSKLPYGTKPNTNPKTNPHPNIILTLTLAIN